MDPAMPKHSEGFGPAEAADAARQAQFTVADDAPTDVNCNAVIAREQAATLTLMGKNFEANANRLNVLANRLVALDKPV